MAETQAEQICGFSKVTKRKTNKLKK